MVKQDQGQGSSSAKEIKAETRLPTLGNSKETYVVPADSVETEFCMNWLPDKVLDHASKLSKLPARRISFSEERLVATSTSTQDKEQLQDLKEVPNDVAMLDSPRLSLGSDDPTHIAPRIFTQTQVKKFGQP